MEKLELNYYIGTNGTLLTHINIPGATPIKKTQLMADEGYKLTKDNKNFYNKVTVLSDEVAEWREVKGQDQLKLFYFLLHNKGRKIKVGGLALL